MAFVHKLGHALKTSAWIPLVVTILTFGLGIVLAEAQIKIGWLPLLAALLICVIIFFLSIVVLVGKVYPMSIALLEDLKKQVDRYVERGAIGWILTNEQLAQYEISAEVDEVWLVTSDLAADIPDSQFYATVCANLERGVRYRYFIPRSFEALARGKQLLENHRKRGDVDVVYLSEDFFFLGPRLDFAIYDPMNRKGLRRGYMQLPVRSEMTVHGDMEPGLVDTIIGKLHSQLEAHTG